MGLFGMIETSASGMGAQANRLSTVSDNIANVNTVGYKKATTEFSSLVLESGPGQYLSGSVETNIHYGIADQGQLEFTTSATDLAVQGNGFFVVQSTNGDTTLTRAGSFVQDSSGNLVNAAGFKLMAYSLANGTPTIVANGTAGLVPVNVGNLALQATPSTSGKLFLNLNSNAAVVPPGNLPSTNSPNAQFTSKTSLVTYDNLGNQVTLDVYASKSAANTWEIAVYNQADATNGGFPYANPALGTQTLTFNPNNGQLAQGGPTSISVQVPNGQTLTLDMSQSSQLAANFQVLNASVNGNAPSSTNKVDIANDGTVFMVFENGTRVATYKIPLASVPSPDHLKPLPGNVYTTSNDSGDIQMGFASLGSLGTINAGSLEQSTVDIASELTTMIESEKNYTANSKVFQTGAQLLDVLVNLVR
jgi:flagellar hook protein FlgE